MKTCICILRGINVGGVIIKMEPLRQSLMSLGFTKVKSYIQSGNLIFQSSISDLSQLKQLIKDKIKTDFGYEIHVMLLSVSSLEEVIKENPILGDDQYKHVTFIEGDVSENKLTDIEAKRNGDEKYVITSKAVYLYCPNGYGKSNLHTNFLESKLKVKATTRNWKTTNELLKIAIEVSEE